MGFLLHNFALLVNALRLFKALRLFFLTNFSGPTVIPCPTSIPDSRVRQELDVHTLQFFIKKDAPSEIISPYSVPG